MKIAVLGYGTVGSGVVEVLDVNQKLIASRAKEKIEVKYVLDLRDFPGDKIQEKIVHDYEIILNDPENCSRSDGRCGTGEYLCQKSAGSRKKCRDIQ